MHVKKILGSLSSCFGLTRLRNVFFSSENKPITELCPSFDVRETELKLLVEAVEENYYFEFMLG